MPINLENFDFIKQRGEELYKSFEPVKCPYFNDVVHFNAQGLEHLKYKKRNRDRLPQDQYMRFKLLYLVPTVLKLSRTLQGRSIRRGFEYVRANNKSIQTFVNRAYFEFIAIIDDMRVRIIVKRLDSGELFFWSIIPYWNTQSNGERALGFGNPEED